MTRLFTTEYRQAFGCYEKRGRRGVVESYFLVDILAVLGFKYTIRQIKRFIRQLDPLGMLPVHTSAGSTRYVVSTHVSWIRSVCR